MEARSGPFWALFDSLPLGAVLFDRADDRLIAFNDAACRQLGYSREQFARLTAADIDLLRSGTGLSGERVTLAVGEPPRRFSTRQRAADGSVRFVDVTLQCIELGGQVYGYAIWSDVTERERAIAELKAREMELARVQRIGRVGGFEIDLRTGFSSLRSPEYLRLYGLPPNAANEPHEAWVQRLHPDDRERIDRLFRDTVAGDAHDYEAEYRTITPDGQIRWISAIAEIERDAAGQALRMIGAHIDITAQRQAESALSLHARRLEDADRRKNEFLAMLGHELRNPLAPILSTIERLQHASAALPAEIAQAHDVIRRQATHLRVLVDELLDVARITTGRIQLTETLVDLGAAVRSAVEQTRDLIERCGHRLVLRGIDDPPGPARIQVRGDVARLTQVVANLLSNAAKYTETGGTITIELGIAPRAGNDREGGDLVVLTVSDTGIGIPPALLPEIFDLFARVGAAPQPAAGALPGLGIGLTLVKRLVDLHRGRIEVSSDGSGKGSRFVVRLPRAEAAGAAMQPVAMADPPNGGADARRILVIDDNIDAAEALAELLRLHGHEVAAHHDGIGALAAALAFRPDIVLLDLGLPERDGYQVASDLRAEAALAGIRLIALTGYGLDEDRRRTQAQGFDHHLVKPIDFAELAQLIDATGDPGNREHRRGARLRRV